MGRLPRQVSLVVRTSGFALALAALAACADDASLPSRAPRGVYGQDGSLRLAGGSGGATGKAGSSSSTGKPGASGGGGSASSCDEPDTGLSTLAVDAREETPTGLMVAVGQRVSISTSGTWCWGLDACCGPDGTPGRPTTAELPVLVPGANLGTLSMRVGSWTRAVGSELEVPAQACGELVLFMNDRAGGYTKDNSGSLKVLVELQSPP